MVGMKGTTEKSEGNGTKEQGREQVDERSGVMARSDGLEAVLVTSQPRPGFDTAGAGQLVPLW